MGKTVEFGVSISIRYESISKRSYESRLANAEKNQCRCCVSRIALDLACGEMNSELILNWHSPHGPHGPLHVSLTLTVAFRKCLRTRWLHTRNSPNCHAYPALVPLSYGDFPRSALDLLGQCRVSQCGSFCGFLGSMTPISSCLYLHQMIPKRSEMIFLLESDHTKNCMYIVGSQPLIFVGESSMLIGDVTYCLLLLRKL